MRRFLVQQIEVSYFIPLALIHLVTVAFETLFLINVVLQIATSFEGRCSSCRSNSSSSLALFGNKSIGKSSRASRQN
jgi:hypothetical protein